MRMYSSRFLISWSGQKCLEFVGSVLPRIHYVKSHTSAGLPLVLNLRDKMTPHPELRHKNDQLLRFNSNRHFVGHSIIYMPVWHIDEFGKIGSIDIIIDYLESLK